MISALLQQTLSREATRQAVLLEWAAQPGAECLRVHRRARSRCGIGQHAPAAVQRWRKPGSA